MLAKRHSNRRSNQLLAKMLAVIVVLTMAASPGLVYGEQANDTAYPLKMADAKVIDPYIMADKATQTYYMYTANLSDMSGVTGNGAMVYQSKDLINWSKPTVVYTVPTQNCWNADEALLNPEVHYYQGKYYLFTTLSNTGDILATGVAGWGGADHWVDNFRRATVIAVSDSPTGPFKDLDPQEPVTDPGLMTRDGTLYVDPDGQPWMVFAQDWIQKIDGIMEAVPLKDDLSAAEGNPIYLFRGSDAAFYKDPEYGASPDFKAVSDKMNVPTLMEGAEVYTTPNGSLVVLWTTCREGKYVQLQAVSRTGNIAGLWEQKEPIITGDKGHAMAFTTFGGEMLMVCQNNMSSGEPAGAELYSVELTDNGFKILSHREDLDGVAGVVTADTTKPKIYVPSTRVVYTTGTAVSYRAFARDDVDGMIDVSYSIEPGSAFDLGRTDVAVTAVDSSGNAASETFTVDVREPEPEAEPVATTNSAISYPLTLPFMTLHDPYILADEASHTYYLYTANNRTMSGDGARGVMAYQSKDLIHWSTPTVVYTVPTTDCWNANSAPWAPEVHYYKGKYYLICTLHNNGVNLATGAPGYDSEHWTTVPRRASMISVADSPEGPFIGLSPQEPVTGVSLDTLDGTLYVAPDGQPYLVYAHEWIQKEDGTIEAIPLTEDLSAAAGEPIYLFKASDAPFYKDPTYAPVKADYNPINTKQLSSYVTDGCELYNTPDGSIVMLWTTYREDRYIELQAISRTGNIAGPWEQLDEKIVADDKGHGMVFNTFEGNKLFVCHDHMSAGTVRGELFDIALTNDGFHITRHRQDLDGVPDVVVGDTTAPKIYVPSTRVAETSADQASVPYTALARDDVDGMVDVSYSIEPGSLFDAGNTEVTVTATDSSGNSSSGSFIVKVVKNASSGGTGGGTGGSGSGGTPAAVTPPADKPAVENGAIKPVPVVTAGVAESKITDADFSKALGSAAADASGKKTVTVDVPAVSGAQEYRQTFPASVLSTGDANVSIKTEVASLKVPGSMFGNAGIQTDSISLSIAKADKSGLKPEIAEQVGDRPVIELNAFAGNSRLSWSNSEAPVTVSMKYVPKNDEELLNNEFITIWYIDGEGNPVPVTNARYDAKTGEVTFTVTHFSKYAVVYSPKTFGDLEGFSWAKHSIEVMASKGAIYGTSSDAFSPSASITRADFLNFVIATLDLKADFTENFTDVSKDANYYNAVGIGKKLGIVSGVGNGKFDPTAQITRQDLMVMAAKALKLAKGLEDGTSADLAGYADADKVRSSAQPSVAALIKAGIIAGVNGRIDPLSSTTRAQAAVIMYNLYNK